MRGLYSVLLVALFAAILFPVVVFAQDNGGGTNIWDIIKLVLVSIATPLIVIVLGFVGTKYVGTAKRKAIATELDEASRRILNAVRLNNPNVGLLENIEFYRKQAFDALIGDPSVPMATSSNSRSVVNSVASAIADELKADDSTGVGHFPTIKR